MFIVKDDYFLLISIFKYHFSRSSFLLLFALLAFGGTALAKSPFSCHSENVQRASYVSYEHSFCNVGNAFVGHSKPIGILSIVASSSSSELITFGVQQSIKYRRGIKKEERFSPNQVVEKRFRTIEISSKQRIQELTSSLPWNIVDTVQLRC